MIRKPYHVIHLAYSLFSLSNESAQGKREPCEGLKLLRDHGHLEAATQSAVGSPHRKAVAAVPIAPPPPPSPSPEELARQQEELAAAAARQQEELAAQAARQQEELRRKQVLEHMAQYRYLGYLNQNGEQRASSERGSLQTGSARGVISIESQSGTRPGYTTGGRDVWCTQVKRTYGEQK